MATLVGNPRHHRSARWILAVFYALLTLGGLSMIYPFWMMVTGSMSGELDFKDRPLIPAYLVNRDELFLKFLVQRYPDFRFMRHVYPEEGVYRASDFRGKIKAPTHAPSPQMMADWEDFLRESLGRPYMMVADPNAVTERYQNFLKTTFGDSAPARGMSAEAWRRLSAIERLNRTYQLAEADFSFLSLPPLSMARPEGEGGPLYADWNVFLESLPVKHLLPEDGASVWQDWLKSHRPAWVNDPARAGFPPADRDRPEVQEAWGEFLTTAWPKSLFENGKPISAETDWRRFLASRYKSNRDLALAWNAEGASITEAPLLLREQDAAVFLRDEGGLRWRMTTRNFIRVAEFIFERGRAVQNTVILVALSILVALTFNPLAAYALSRNASRSGKMTLTLLVLTIAFPAEVSMIPSFLLLRDLNLLNTYAALILPGAVSGFSVFLLKGFFDGLPQELYESAKIDGASELQTFWNVVVPLTKPILAVIALGVFTSTYGAYMWALLVCQDERMWTLMVWLFQFQMQYSDQPWLGMAAFVFASLPTLLVFIFCQRLILRGIIIPTEK